MVKVGDKAPDFSLLDQDGETVSLSGLQGHKVLVYFFPGTATPGALRPGGLWPYTGRTRRRSGVMPATESRRRSRRLELRTTPDERDLIDRAVAASDTDVTEFVVSTAVEAARRVLADRDRFDLDAEAVEAWATINARPARDLPGLRRLMDRPSPFAG